MVVSLGPGKFYGSSLPRPRIYTVVKFNDHRVDPPVPVLDPLMSWANEAHWTMGGLSLKRLRLQGKIEGNLQNLKKEDEKILKKNPQNSTPNFKPKGKGSSFLRKGSHKSVDSPPGAPVSRKLTLRSRVIVADDEGEEEISLKEIQKGVQVRKRRRLVRKLGDDFEKVADDNGKSKRSPLKDVSNGEGAVSVASRTKTRSMVLMDEEEEESEDDVGLRKSKDAGVGNGENGGKGASEKSGEMGSVSPGGTRSSPRLKQKSS